MPARPRTTAARPRYQQTKIAGAPQAILVDADVVAIVTEQQDFAHPGRARDQAAPDPPYLFLAWQANTGGQRHYRASTLNGLLTQLAAALQVTDATGRWWTSSALTGCVTPRPPTCSTRACRCTWCSVTWITRI